MCFTAQNGTDALKYARCMMVIPAGVNLSHNSGVQSIIHFELAK